MRKTIIITLIFLLSAMTALAENKIDPFLSMNLSKNTGKSMTKSVGDDSNPMLNVFISSNNVDITEEKILEIGGTVSLKLKSVLTATLPYNSIENLSQTPEVTYIEAGRPVSSKNDDATFDINSTEVNNGVSLPSKFKGKGVIIGIVDTGIDYLNPVFKDEDGKNRILYIWDQTKSGNAPSEISGSYGSECSTESISDETCNLKDVEGHGTHVAGTAGGFDDNYSGVAPEANIIAVTYKSEIELEEGKIEPIFSTTICEAVYYIFSKADKLNKPAVVNLSLGTHIGPHDGTSLFEKCLEEIVSDSAGRAIVAAAGNEYSESSKYASIYAGGDINGKSYMPFEIREPSYSPVFYLDLWCTGDNLSFSLGKYKESASSNFEVMDDSVNLGEKKSGTLLKNLGEYVIDARETKNPNNGKSHIGVMIYPDAEKIKNETLLLSISGNGKCDGWWYPDKPSNAVNFLSSGISKLENVIYGSNENTITSPATSPAVIAVGAYVTKSKWQGKDDMYGVPYNIGEIMYFSSSGPTANLDQTGIKPDITAPGGMIISTKSSNSSFPSYLLVDDNHVVMAGTSMASPFVAGTVALMFEAVPNLTYQDIKKYLAKSASGDDSTGELPNNRWGHGKLNTYEAVLTAINEGGAGDFDANANLDKSVSSGIGCNIVSKNTGKPLSFVFLIISIMFLSVLKKRMS